METLNRKNGVVTLGHKPDGTLVTHDFNQRDHLIFDCQPGEGGVVAAASTAYNLFTMDTSYSRILVVCPDEAEPDYKCFHQFATYSHTPTIQALKPTSEKTLVVLHHQPWSAEYMDLLNRDRITTISLVDTTVQKCPFLNRLDVAIVRGGRNQVYSLNGDLFNPMASPAVMESFNA